MIIWKGKEIFKKFLVLLDSGCSSTSKTERPIKNLLLKKMIWCSGTRKRVKLTPIQRDSTLPELIKMQILTWSCYMYDSAKGIYDMILGRYMWT